MKGRIGKYKDKIVVWGDPNLTAKNEINIDSLGGEGGGQVDIPVEYYKVVAPEGEDLNNFREGVFTNIDILLNEVSCFHILVKGTGLGYYSSFAGVPLMIIGAQEKFSVHAYAIRAIHTITKIVTSDGTISEIPSFNNIFDAFDSILPSISLQLKSVLVPITAEEFYNLDDIE